MAASTVDRNTPFNYLQRQNIGKLAAGAIVPAGVITAVNAAGLIPNGGSSDAPGLKVVGRSEHAADQTKGDAELEYSRGCFAFNMSAALLAAAQANIEREVYLVDNQTVGLASDTINRIAVGTLREVQGNQAYVDVGLQRSDLAGGEVINNSRAPGALTVHVVALPDAAGDVDVILRDKEQVLDVLIEKQGGAAGAFANTIQVKNGANPISDAISINGAADGDVKRAANINDAFSTIDSNGTLRFTTVKAGGNAQVQATVYTVKRA